MRFSGALDHHWKLKKLLFYLLVRMVLYPLMYKSIWKSLQNSSRTLFFSCSLCLLLPHSLFVSYFRLLSLSLTSPCSLCLSLPRTLFVSHFLMLFFFFLFIYFFLPLYPYSSCLHVLCVVRAFYNLIWFVPYCVLYKSPQS